jgi:CRP-like cAMP-binding protein
MPSDLKKVLLFSDFTHEELQEVRSFSRKSKISKGEYIFREGDPGNSLIILDLGTLKLTKKTRSGDEQELVTLGSGVYVGEMAILDEGFRRSASGQALEPCEITVIPLQRLRSFLDKDPSLAARFYRRLAMGIAQRLRYMNEDFAALKNFLAHWK